LIFILIYFELRDTENQQYLGQIYRTLIGTEFAVHFKMTGTTVDQLDMWSARSFLFSIVNPAGIGPVKLNIRPEKTDKALRQDPQSGPVFGENDLYIGDSADQSAVSFSDLGYAYELPDNPFGAGTLDARKFFAGSYKFIVDDIEVFRYVGKFSLTIVYVITGDSFTAFNPTDSHASRRQRSGDCIENELINLAELHTNVPKLHTAKLRHAADGHTKKIP